MNKTKVLFVCLGNICRSPAAEGVFSHLVKEQGLEDVFEIDSAGTNGLHNGEDPDVRMRSVCANAGVELTSHSRQIKAQDLSYFDHIIVMDDSNLKNVLKLTNVESDKKKVKKMTDFVSDKFKGHTLVPDPYYGGEEGFILVLELLKDSCSQFLNTLK